MGFEVDVHPSGGGGLVQTAHEARGMDIPMLAAAIAEVTPFQVRSTITARPWSDSRIEWRRLARSTSDAAIVAALDALTAERLAEIEADPRTADLLSLAAIGVATNLPLAFFLKPNPPRPIGWVHFHERTEWCEECMEMAEYQCDYPAGTGTCDAWLCAEHATVQGEPEEDRHYCTAHKRKRRSPHAALPSAAPASPALRPPGGA